MFDQDLRQMKHHGRRWRVAFIAIRFTRLIASILSKKILENHSLAIEILDDDDDDDGDPPGEVNVCMPLMNVDQKTLIDNIVVEKSTELLNRLGGPKQVAAILGSNEKEGLPAGEVELEHRRQVFGANGCKKKQQPMKSFATLFLESLKEKTLIILLVCAVMSLVFGIKQHGLKHGCSDGASNIIAVLLVVFVSSMTKLELSSQFRKVSYEMSNIKVHVVRGGRHFSVSIYDIVVGDVVCLRIGDQVPADGLLLDGYSMKVDESCLRSGDGSQIVEINSSRNPFLLSGTKVTNGYGSMLVTSVGTNTTRGEMMSSRNDELFLNEQQTPIQVYLNKLTSRISKTGLAMAMVVSIVLWFNHREKNIAEMVKAIVGFINIAVTIVALAIPEGLPLAATLTLAYSMKQMMKNNAMVLKLAACETMASATTICADTRGTLTLNHLKTVEFWLGKEAIEGNNASTEIAPEVYVLLQEGIALNTTGAVDKQPSPAPISSTNVFGGPIEKAILSWAVLDVGMDVNEAKENCEIIDVEVSIHPETKRSGVLLVRKSNGSEIHTHWKGDAEIILAMCSSYYVITGAEKEMDEEAKLQFEAIIQSMAAKGLNCIAFAHKRVIESNGNASEKLEETGLSLLALVGMKDALHQGIRTEIDSCKDADVGVKIVSGDNMYAARAIAIECGILNPEATDEAVIEGVQFRNYSFEERMERVDNIRVMARSSPLDKLLLVQCLKAKGHVVAVTGGGIDDAAALKEADIGLFMGTHEGIQVMKESSGILILNGSFASVVTVLKWARCFYNNVQNFIQFQLTVNVSAFVFNFIAVVSFREIPLTSIQLLWVNLLVDILGVLAFSTYHPTDDLLSRPPVGWWQPLISYIIWKKVLIQALFQVFILLIVQFKGGPVFGWDENLKNTLIFNIFALFQLFSVFNARVFFMKKMFRIKGLLENKLFFVVIATAALVQVLIVEFSNKVTNAKRLQWSQWFACIVTATLSLVIGQIVK